MNLNDLPDEMLCMIFDYLDVYELKLASLVCRRWSELTFSGRRMDRVLLVLPDSEYWNKYLINTKRCYRNVRATPFSWIDDHSDSLLLLLHTMKPHVRMLEIETIISYQQLRSVLLEASELQQLSIRGSMDFDQMYCKNNASLQALTELKPNQRQLFSFFRTNIPNLQCLKMNCWKEHELAAWKILSEQLKLVDMRYLDPKDLHFFLQLTFPHLKDLTFRGVGYFSKQQRIRISNISDDFFRRHSFLRRLSMCEYFPVELWVESVTRYCPELTYLRHRFAVCPGEGFLESLVQLKKLKHLSLDGVVERKILRGAMSSLESVTLSVTSDEVLLENLFEVVPRLSCLKTWESLSCDVLPFICEKFSCLRRLELFLHEKHSQFSRATDSVRLDRLVHLQELKLSGDIDIHFFHRNNVRCLTLGRCSITDNNICCIPEKFPLLKRLIILSDYAWLHVAAVKRLQQLMPSCRIDWKDERFYPIDDVTAD